MPALAPLLAALRDRLGVRSKQDIGQAVGARWSQPQGAPWLGDDCAAIPDGDGYLLFAIEGLLQSFVEEDPWFAGYSAVMVNISDVCAMGGEALAVVDAVWARSEARFAEIWAGMQAASDRYGVPIVGGHTNLRSQSDQLAVAVTGRAQKLLTSFEAKPGDALIMAVDLRGAYRGAKNFWNASSGAPDPQRLRDDLKLLPELAEAGLAHAAKDISMGGVLGTALMLAECSGVGAVIDLDAVPKPTGQAGQDLVRWYSSFPSYGYLLAVEPRDRAAVVQRFTDRGIAAAAIGQVQDHSRLDAQTGQQTETFWDWHAEPLLRLGVKPAALTV